MITPNSFKLKKNVSLDIKDNTKLNSQLLYLSRSCLNSSSAERLPNKATVRGGDTPTTLAGCKSVCHKSDDNSRAELLVALSSCTTGVPASCEDDGCQHPAGSPSSSCRTSVPQRDHRRPHLSMSVPHP
ncbi:hypothetical protein PoB_000377000 [Plakobranchus ocellatus]|uniref:Uncharacterized protein n=1 Tax=Plakobranchus ocellatus TaxID=259542 RepID=A0AAV3Y365_9GAST|nr:hypothetical protein PoB_000377000 [Plakobranchus ocellatus]